MGQPPTTITAGSATAATQSPDDALPATPPATSPDPWVALRSHTPARIALGRSGNSLPTHEVLRFAAAHAQARDAVHVPLDRQLLAEQLHASGWQTVLIQSRADSRATYLRRPDLGRRLHADSAQQLLELAAHPASEPAPESTATATATSASASAAPDLALVVADGLSASAAQQHALATLQHLRLALQASAGGALRLSPVCLAHQGRVALADEVGALWRARAVLILLGERPGLSSPDSLGAYLTFAPNIGRSDAERNCVSNIRPQGLPPAHAGARLAWLVLEALRRQISGVALKDDSAALLLAHGASQGVP